MKPARLRLPVDDCPALEWIEEIPEGWVTPLERLLLVALALDSFDGHTCAPGRASLMAFCGVSDTRTFQRLQRSLSASNDDRPALLDIQGERGRATRYTLKQPEASKRHVRVPAPDAQPDARKRHVRVPAPDAQPDAQPDALPDASPLTESPVLSSPSLEEEEARPDEHPTKGDDRAVVVRQIIPPPWHGLAIQTADPRLDVLDLLQADGWTARDLRAACTSLPTPRKNPTGLLVAHLRQLRGHNPATITVLGSPTTAPECPHHLALHLFCRDCENDQAVPQLVQGVAL